ncbi:hypothetical protein ASD54_05605 [Rhizobium sp. Root149]|jgi:Ni/Co efflux regulator RcnB|uniref:Ni/Co efflux regulator RcnB n=1 Tax=Rhizobium rhizoryzae TaxID=451876 RepID=A0A7W6LCK8_9HYPH|nr:MULTISPECIES: RcnB family protein [Rhizobium]KQZ54783.1 hypothetical protein ASD54_05605 [Rhizobium sp. Root149]MBB4141889.1 Ni/Co efflux regulator RcnB [Rhizobium rhizoryzae]
MKTIVTLLTAATILAAPMAQAQDHRGHGPDRTRTVERTVIEKRTIVKKQRWHRGQKLSRAERARLAEIRDYRRYRLSAPPRGYHWVRVNNEFLLIGVTSGIIANIIAGR